MQKIVVGLLNVNYMELLNYYSLAIIQTFHGPAEVLIKEF